MPHRCGKCIDGGVCAGAFHFTSLACQAAFTVCANFCGIRALHPPLGVAAAHFHLQPDMLETFYPLAPPIYFSLFQYFFFSVYFCQTVGRHKFHLSVHCFGVWKSTHQKIGHCSCSFAFVRVILIPLMDEWMKFSVGYSVGLSGGIKRTNIGYYLGFGGEYQ